MELTEFRQKKVEGREKLTKRIMDVLKEENPIAIHQFGSGVNGYKDELSDMDMWATFDDSVIDDIISRRDEIYIKIDKVLIKSELAQNSPLGGKYSLVIFDTENGPYHVDFYFSKLSQTNIRTDAMFLHGTDSLPRGEWIMDKNAINSEVLEDMINHTITMTFILIKAIIRGGWNEVHANYLRHLYNEIQRVADKTLEPLLVSSDFVFFNALLDNLATDSNEQQKEAVSKIKDYANKVEESYRQR